MNVFFSLPPLVDKFAETGGMTPSLPNGGMSTKFYQMFYYVTLDHWRSTTCIVLLRGV